MSVPYHVCAVGSGHKLLTLVSVFRWGVVGHGNVGDTPSGGPLVWDW